MTSGAFSHHQKAIWQVVMENRITERQKCTVLFYIKYILPLLRGRCQTSTWMDKKQLQVRCSLLAQGFWELHPEQGREEKRSEVLGAAHE